jgi:hypothetical protein
VTASKVIDSNCGFEVSTIAFEVEQFTKRKKTKIIKEFFI